jgi:hypothetical protein
MQRQLDCFARFGIRLKLPDRKLTYLLAFLRSFLFLFIYYYYCHRVFAVSTFFLMQQMGARFCTSVSPRTLPSSSGGCICHIEALGLQSVTVPGAAAAAAVPRMAFTQRSLRALAAASCFDRSRHRRSFVVRRPRHQRCDDDDASTLRRRRRLILDMASAAACRRGTVPSHTKTRTQADSRQGAAHGRVKRRVPDRHELHPCARFVA